MTTYHGVSLYPTYQNGEMAVFAVSMLSWHAISKTAADNKKRVHFLQKEIYRCSVMVWPTAVEEEDVELLAVVLFTSLRGWRGGHRRVVVEELAIGVLLHAQDTFEDEVIRGGVG